MKHSKGKCFRTVLISSDIQGVLMKSFYVEINAISGAIHYKIKSFPLFISRITAQSERLVISLCGW